MSRTRHVSVQAGIGLFLVLFGLNEAVRAADQVVTNNNDSGAGSLRQAMLDVHDGGTITFDGDYTITLASNLPQINDSITIVGRGCEQTIIDGDGAYRILYVVTGSLTASHLTVRNGKAVGNLNAGTLLLDGVVIDGNTDVSGAGLRQSGTGGSTSTTLLNCTISNNFSPTNRGGGIYATVGTVTIKNSTITGNTAQYNGAGICCESSGAFVIDSCTIANNHTTGTYGTARGGGIRVAGGSLTITNTIIANNQDDYGNNDYSYQFGTLTDNGYNFVEVPNVMGANGFSNGVNHNIVGVNPTGLASTLSYEGGWTPVLKITGGTFTGGNYGSTSETRDQRGYHRKSGEITRGAYQYGGTVAVVNGGAWNNGYPTIADAIAAASANDTITLLDTVIKEVGITINKNLTIQGQGATSTYVWGDNAKDTASGRIFDLVAGDVALRDMSIQYGRATRGGGVRGGGGTHTLADCAIVGNTSTLGGGGIHNVSDGTLHVADCSIVANAGGSRGGGLDNEGVLTMTRSTIVGNVASNGGGVSTSGGNAALQNCTICWNTGGSVGGGLYALDGTTVLANCTLAENHASAGTGDGLYGYIGYLGLINTIVINNTGSGGQENAPGLRGIRAQNSWFATNAGITTPTAASNVFAAYTAGDLLSLADNGGSTWTMELAATAPAVGTGDFVYYNTTDGFYCEDSNGDYRDALGSVVTPSDPASDKITIDQCGVTRTSPVSIGAFFTPKATPSVTTTTVSNVTGTTAKSGGNVTYEGQSGVTARGVCWNTTGTPTTTSDKTSDGTGTGAFTSDLSNLSPATTYYVRAYATNTQGTDYGTERQFTTSAAKPTVTTAAVTGVTTDEATSGGDVTDDGGDSVTAYGVCWNTDGTPTTSDDNTNDGSGTGTFTSTLTSLAPGMTYYVRAYATNSAGTGYGNDVEFTTVAAPPTMTTAAVSHVTATTATTGGEVMSSGGAPLTAFGVCWNTTGSPTTADETTMDCVDSGLLAGDGGVSRLVRVRFTSSMTGLMPGTTYYVRAYATNSKGTGYGNEVEFTTNGTTPTVTTASVTDITSATATSGGEVTSDGSASITARGVCWNKTGTPTIADERTTDGSGIGVFASSITGLDADTAYYVRAYATNKAGTTYGAERTFSTKALPDDPNDANNDPPTAPDLRVSIAAARSSASVGEELGFSVNVENVGTASATGVTLRFPLPAGTELVGVWLVGGLSSQTAPLDAVVDGGEIVVALGDVSASESLQFNLVLRARSAGSVAVTAAASCDEKETPATAQVESQVEVDDVYVEIIGEAVPIHVCGLMGFVSPLLALVGLAAMKRYGRRW
ncbi:MAG: hypothetical protein PVJ57_10745 [Phycisphaerae bacterium]|jgi:parallel beta-helix repeat protein